MMAKKMWHWMTGLIGGGATLSGWVYNYLEVQKYESTLKLLISLCNAPAGGPGG